MDVCVCGQVGRVHIQYDPLRSDLGLSLSLSALTIAIGTPIAVVAMAVQAGPCHTSALCIVRDDHHAVPVAARVLTRQR